MIASMTLTQAAHYINDFLALERSDINEEKVYQSCIDIHKIVLMSFRIPLDSSYSDAILIPYCRLLFQYKFVQLIDDLLCFIFNLNDKILSLPLPNKLLWTLGYLLSDLFENNNNDSKNSLLELSITKGLFMALSLQLLSTPFIKAKLHLSKAIFNGLSYCRFEDHLTIRNSISILLPWSMDHNNNDHFEGLVNYIYELRKYLQLINDYIPK